MKVIFLDIDGVLQPKSAMRRMQHIKEIDDLAKELTDRLHNGFDYYDFIGAGKGAMYGKVPQADYDVAAVYWDWSQEADKMIRALSLNDGPYFLPGDFKDQELENWRKIWVYNSSYYY